MSATKITRLGIFQAYDYFKEVAAKRELVPSEQAFYDYCANHHDEICEGTLDKDVLDKASELYDYCVDNRGVERAQLLK